MDKFGGVCVYRAHTSVACMNCAGFVVASFERERDKRERERERESWRAIARSKQRGKILNKTSCIVEDLGSIFVPPLDLFQYLAACEGGIKMRYFPFDEVNAHSVTD